jgi:hypothetical protein
MKKEAKQEEESKAEILNKKELQNKMKVIAERYNKIQHSKEALQKMLNLQNPLKADEAHEEEDEVLKKKSTGHFEDAREDLDGEEEMEDYEEVEEMYADNKEEMVEGSEGFIAEYQNNQIEDMSGYPSQLQDDHIQDDEEENEIECEFIVNKNIHQQWDDDPHIPALQIDPHQLQEHEEEEAEQEREGDISGEPTDEDIRRYLIFANESAIKIQKLVRGWLIRTQIQKIKEQLMNMDNYYDYPPQELSESDLQPRMYSHSQPEFLDHHQLDELTPQHEIPNQIVYDRDAKAEVDDEEGEGEEEEEEEGFEEMEDDEMEEMDDMPQESELEAKIKREIEQIHKNEGIDVEVLENEDVELALAKELEALHDLDNSDQQPFKQYGIQLPEKVRSKSGELRSTNSEPIILKASAERDIPLDEDTQHDHEQDLENENENSRETGLANLNRKIEIEDIAIKCGDNLRFDKQNEDQRSEKEKEDFDAITPTSTTEFVDKYGNLKGFESQTEKEKIVHLSTINTEEFKIEDDEIIQAIEEEEEKEQINSAKEIAQERIIEEIETEEEKTHEKDMEENKIEAKDKARESESSGRVKTSENDEGLLLLNFLYVGFR